MYIKRHTKGPHTYYSLVESYRDKKTGKVRQRRIKYFGREVPDEYKRYLYKGQMPLE